MTRYLEISVPATLTSVRGVRRKVAAIAMRANAADHVVDDIELCVSEAVTNSVVHGYGNGEGTVDIAVDLEQDELTVVVSDRGRGLTDFVRDGDVGYGLPIIERLTRRLRIASAHKSGTEVRMVFDLERSLHPAGRPRRLASSSQR